MLPFGGFAIPVGNAMMPEGIITGRPIRESSDQGLLAPTRGLSQLATPFFASQAKLSIKQRQRVGPASHGCLRDHVWRLSRSYRYALHPPCICWAALAFLYLCPFHDQPYLFVEVIRPQVPLRPPCYDFSPLVKLRFSNVNKARPHQDPTRVKRRAVCARSRDVFTAR